MSAKSTTTFHPETARKLLGWAEERTTGTLRAALPETPATFLIEEGRLRDVAFENSDTLDLAFSQVLDAASYRKAAKAAAKEGCSVGTAILRLGLLDDSQAIEAVLAFLTGCISEALKLPPSELFLERLNKAPAALSDLGTNYELSVPLHELLFNALAEFEAWDFVVENVPSVRDVYYATPRAVMLFDDGEDHAAEAAILQAVDGKRDVAEVIEAAGLEPFSALSVVNALADEGFIELVNPVQLFQLGVAAEEAGNWEKALHLYQRALQRGLDDFDLQLRLARALDKTGHTDQAVERYLHFAERCAEEFRLEDARRALKRAAELKPDDLQVRRNFVELLVRSDQKAEAARASIELAGILAGRAQNEEAVEALRQAINLAPEDAKLLQQAVQLARRLEAGEEAAQAEELLKKVFAEQADTQEALQFYQRRLLEGDDSLEVRLKLIDLHLAQGNHQQALEHLDVLLFPPHRFGILDNEHLRRLHRKRYELCPGDRRSLWFLIEDARLRGDRAQAVTYLRELIGKLNPEEDGQELTGALKRLVDLAPQALEYRKQLAAEYVRAGKLDEAVKLLRDYAEVEAEAGRQEEAVQALGECVRLVPFDIQSREQLAALLEDAGEAEEARWHRRLLGLAAIICGDLSKAQELLGKGLAPEEEALVAFLLADLCAHRGDRRMAAEQYGRAGKLFLSGKNFGLAKHCAHKLRQQGTHAPLAEEIERGVEAALKPAPQVPKQGSTTESGDEAFAAVKQRVVKGSVASITARLRSLKVGTPLGPQGAQNKPQGGNAKKEERAQTVSVSSALSKLKALSKGKAGGAGAPPAEKAPKPEPVETGPEPEPPNQAQEAKKSEGGTPSAAKLKGAAARLRALKGGPQKSGGSAPKGRKSETDQGEPAEEKPIEPTAPVQKKAKLNSAASRLAKLRKS